MNDDALTRLEQRIFKLEAANRRWKHFAACSVIVFACVGLMAAQRDKAIKADQIETQRIIVRDARGRELITLGMIDEKFPGMRLKLPGSETSASFFTGADHATLALMDHNGASSITLNSGTAKSRARPLHRPSWPGPQGPTAIPGPVHERVPEPPCDSRPPADQRDCSIRGHSAGRHKRIRYE